MGEWEEAKVNPDSWVGEVHDGIKVQIRRHQIEGSADGDFTVNGNMKAAANQW